MRRFIKFKLRYVKFSQSIINYNFFHLPLLLRFFGSLQRRTIFRISSLSRSSKPPLASTSVWFSSVKRRHVSLSLSQLKVLAYLKI